MTNSINNRLKELRSAISQHGCDAIIIPSNDPHQSEYVSDYWKARAHFSGFSGSAGTLVITPEVSALWTDSRYFEQVEIECSENEVELYKQTIPHAPEHIEWLVNRLSKGQCIGLNQALISTGLFQKLEMLAAEKGIVIKHLGEEVLPWNDRPDMFEGQIYDHKPAYAGKTRSDKLALVRDQMKKLKCQSAIYNRLDDIAWLFNLRASDVDYTPLFYGYAVVNLESVKLFVHEGRISKDLELELAKDEIQVFQYNEFDQHVSQLNGITLYDPSSLDARTSNLIGENYCHQPSIIGFKKSIKNTIELHNARAAHKRDGIAMVKFLTWLKQHLESSTITEFELGKKLESFRSGHEFYKGQSFGVIAGYNGNGAIIHYGAEEESCKTISNDGVLLLDSGAQYLDATTDITRTLWLGGSPSFALKRDYTLVLKGLIELSTIHFPKGTTGSQLDTLARMHLWKQGQNYGHGTGHGIGAFGMVHEPPQGFATSHTTTRGSDALHIGQLTTIEPGYYKTNEYGIRIENIVCSAVSGKNQDFIKFETFTLCPIDTTLIDTTMLTKSEIEWINSYHRTVKTELQNGLNVNEQEWLSKACEPI